MGKKYGCHKERDEYLEYEQGPHQKGIEDGNKTSGKYVFLMIIFIFLSTLSLHAVFHMVGSVLHWIHIRWDGYGLMG